MSLFYETLFLHIPLLIKLMSQQLRPIKKQRQSSYCPSKRKYSSNLLPFATPTSPSTIHKKLRAQPDDEQKSPSSQRLLTSFRKKIKPMSDTEKLQLTYLWFRLGENNYSLTNRLVWQTWKAMEKQEHQLDFPNIPNHIPYPETYPPDLIASVEIALYEQTPTYEKRPYCNVISKNYYVQAEQWMTSANNELLTHIHMFSNSQLTVIRTFIDIQRQIIINGYKPFQDPTVHFNRRLFLCTTAPNSGYQMVLDFLQHLSDTCCTFHIVNLAYTGLAAVQSNGTTLHCLLKLSSLKLHDASPPPLHSDLKKLTAIVNAIGIHNIGKQLPILVLNEINMITPTMLATLDATLQHVTGNKVDFGGIPLFLFGDFNQVPPISGTSLPCAMVDAAKNLPGSRSRTYPISSAYRRGISVFSKATWLPLQPRLSRGADHLHIAIFQHLSSNKPLSRHLLRPYKLLSASDLLHPNSPWLFPHYICSTIQDCMNIASSQNSVFALKNNTMKVRWPATVDHATKNVDAILQSTPIFWQEFVIGAPVYITSNLNLSKKISNGTLAYLHSYLVHDKSDLSMLAKLLQTKSSDDTLTLPKPPDKVIVELFRNNKVLRNNWLQKYPSLSTHKVLIPLSTTRTCTQTVKHVIYQQDDTYHSTVRLSYPFPYESAFASTIFKTQGRTLRNLVLVFNKTRGQQWNSRQLFTVLSKVKTIDDIRFLCPHGMSREEVINAVVNLSPNMNTYHYFRGFRYPNTTWSLQDCQNSLQEN